MHRTRKTLGTGLEKHRAQKSDKKKQIVANEMRMLWWMCGVTRKGNISNERPQHARENKSGAGFQRDHRETTELVWAGDERRITRTGRNGKD